MQIVIHPDGSLRTLYDEAIDLVALGAMSIRRASHVEPDDVGAANPQLGQDKNAQDQDAM